MERSADKPENSISARRFKATVIPLVVAVATLSLLLYLAPSNKDVEAARESAYSEGYEAAYQEGYDTGYSEAQDELRYAIEAEAKADEEGAYKEGHDDGYKEGLIDGRAVALEEYTTRIYDRVDVFDKIYEMAYDEIWGEIYDTYGEYLW